MLCWEKKITRDYIAWRVCYNKEGYEMGCYGWGGYICDVVVG